MYEELKSGEIGIARIFTISTNIFKNNFINFFMLAIIINLPINILENFIISKDINNIMISWIKIILLFLTILSSIGVAYIVENNIKENISVHFTEAFNYAFKNWIRVTYSMVIVLLLVLSGVFLFIIPGVIFAVYYMFVIVIVSLRNVSGIRALRYSRLLVKGNWGKMFGYSILIGSGNFIVVSVLMLGAMMMFNNPIVTILTQTLCNFLSSFFIICITVLFLNVDYVKNIDDNF